MAAHISRRQFLIASALGGATAALTSCAPGQAAYKPSGPGIVDVVVPYATGGGTDTWARFVTPYFADVLDDVERFQVSNIAGGQSVTGTNAYVDAGVNNGRYLLVSSGTTYFNGLLGKGDIQYDFTDMSPLVLHGTGAVMYANANSGIEKMEDLLDRGREATFGGISAAGLDLIPVLAVKVLGGDVNGVFGFQGNGPARLAINRGEIDVGFDTTSSYLSQIKPKVEAQEMHPLLSVGVPDKQGKVTRDPAMPEIPTLEELYRNIHGREPSGQAYEAYHAFVTSGFFYQKGLWSSTGTDGQLVDKYADAVEILNSDERFIEEAAGALGGYEMMPGRGNAENFQRSMTIDSNTLDFVKTFLNEEHGAAFE
ncbi:tripartite tricarboxylate transporter substrate binding protein [Prauserella halophila]|uniref:Tripartite tricarboxylate transporter substrate binding protein n=1 Tax=Prauserella halophila TaxID=185641 RepID=A0ABN1W462_9PSEU|nr:substrate-binding domain-containing protein [Prauserella halophila]MCP2235967.1 Tat (twin-arginine translocation) pathway signal sequence [Prauserella halophila]